MSRRSLVFGVRIPTIGITVSVVLVLLSIGVVARAADCASADRVALGWLDKMSRSLHQVNYHGVVTLQRGEDMQVMQVSHAVNRGVGSDQMTQLTGQGAQVERVNHPLHCVHPGHRLLQLGEAMLGGNCGIAAHYRFAVDDGERVAGRKAVRVRIEPRDMYRFGYVMELDRETGLLLKTKTIGRGDKVLEKFQFASLSYEARPSSVPDVDVVHRARHSLPAPPGSVIEGWSVNWVPGGFTYTDAPAGAMDRRTYTDGLAVFSVFLEELGLGIRPGEGVVRSGGTTSYTRGLQLTGKPVLITVIGEVPVNTARMVADSVGWQH